jgi:hypothetical protein
MVDTSTSASQPKPSAPGFAFVTGLAILANPRAISASKTIVLDVQIYLGPTDKDLLIGTFRYFNLVNATFDDGPSLYQIGATVSILLVSITIYINFQFARRESLVDASDSQAHLDYTFVGDIQWESDIVECEASLILRKLFSRLLHHSVLQEYAI